MEDESFLGGVSTAWDAVSDGVSAVGDAAYDVGAAGYHHAAGTADYLLNDMDGAAEHDDARNAANQDRDAQFDRIGEDYSAGADGLDQAYDAGADAVDAAGDAAYDVGAAGYHHAAGTADYLMNDMDGAAEQDDARNAANQDRDEQFDRASADIGY